MLPDRGGNTFTPAVVGQFAVVMSPGRVRMGASQDGRTMCGGRSIPHGRAGARPTRAKTLFCVGERRLVRPHNRRAGHLPVVPAI